MQYSLKKILLGCSAVLFAACAGCSPSGDAPEKLPEGNYFTDLHLHIDGSMSPDIALKLAEMQNVTLPTYDKSELLKLLQVPEDCTDLNEYLERFALPCSLMMTKETISEMVYLLQEELLAEGVIYAELRFAPQLHLEQGLTQEEVVQAAIEGLSRSSLRANLILCCMRGDSNKAENMETVRLADKYRNDGVVAVDLAGAEALFPTSDFEDVFAYAKSLNLTFTIHAGEASGPESVKKAMEFGTARIGHGVHSAQDEALLQQLASTKIPLELCITSNLQTKAEESLDTYPLRKLMEAGVVVTLNTDNPVVSGTSVRREFELAKKSFGLSNSEVKELLLNSVSFSFADGETKEYLKSEIEKAFE